MPLDFRASREEMKLFAAIAERADKEIYQQGAIQSPITTIMDINLAHNDCPLDLEALLAAKPFDFAHDVAGIRTHLNRQTGVLEGCFLPRFARHPVEVAK